MAEKLAGAIRNPGRTHEAILAAAREVLARDGKEGLTVDRVAQLAGVNRSTAYQHFQTRDQLVAATAAWVSDKLYRAVFGDPMVARDEPVETINVEAVNERLAEFAMENPALGCVWLFEVLSSPSPASDPFQRQYQSNFEKFAATDLAQANIDVEVVSILFLAGSFIWPIWAKAHSRTAKERRLQSARFAREILRLCLHGTLRPENDTDLDARVTKRQPLNAVHLGA